MRVIRVTLDRRAEGIRAEIAMSPSVVDELVESFYDLGSVGFNADEDLAIELDLEVSDLDPEEEPEDQIARVEFRREPEDYLPMTDDEE
jgi:hypothetical protein